MSLSFIKSSGSIISDDFCNELLNESKAEYVRDISFGDHKRIDEHIAVTFQKLRERWETHRSKILNNEFETTELRSRWIIPLLKALDFNPLFNKSNVQSTAGTEYHLNYKGWNNKQAVPIHMVQSSQDLDIRDKTNRTHANKSPHDMVQAFLNTSHHQWAIVTNGKKIRILRDFYHSITKGFLEFDIEGIFETASSEHFRVLFRVLHQSRFENQYQEETSESLEQENQKTCILETFHKKSRETGVKIGNKLRDQVKEAIELLGNGFAENLNPDDYKNGKVKEYYAEILNVIYRLLFLMFAEQKGWLPVRNPLYAHTYSINSLKTRAEKQAHAHDDEMDIWEGLKITFRLVTNGYTFSNGDKINAFGGQLFSNRRIPTLLNQTIKNKYVLEAIHQLSFFQADGLRSKINYANLAIDELGSVYESLLDYDPKMAQVTTELEKRTVNRGEFYLDDSGTDRKTSGSYYTDSRLVAQLIDSALVPVINNAVEPLKAPEEKEAALLELKVADIACGSGAFICAALEKMGEVLAQIRMGDEERPTEEQLREAKRDVLINCIYGVDLNPMALELAKFSLWITAAMPDMPLSFLDHKLKCGNALIGATPELIKAGIPADAYKPIGNDDPDVCKEYRTRVKNELKGMEGNQGYMQLGLTMKVTLVNNEADIKAYLALVNNDQDSVEAIEELETEYTQVHESLQHSTEWRLADTWTSSFFIEKTDFSKTYPTNQTLYDLRQGNAVDEELINEIESLSKKHNFFHYHLEYPEVFEKGGFDCLLGNPPWEKINLKDEEFFATRNPDIKNARNKSERKELIKALPESDPELYNEYIEEKRTHDALSLFFRSSNHYPLTGVSRINLYSVFAEQYDQLINATGATGNVLPTGIIVDNNNKDFYFNLIKKGRLDTVIDYENKKGLFPDVHRMYRFCLFVTVAKNGRNLYKFYRNEPDNEDDFLEITLEDIEAINPNTKTCPSFRNKQDYLIARKIYKSTPVLNNTSKPELNIWKVKLRTPFNMANDSALFNTESSEGYLPLYEAKYIYHYDHRYSTYLNGSTRNLTKNEYENQNIGIQSQYYLSKKELDIRFKQEGFFLVYRMITNSTNERTMVSSLIPAYPCGHSLSVIEVKGLDQALFLTSIFNSFTFDFICRQAVGGTNFNHWILNQLPVIHPDKFPLDLVQDIVKKSFSLTYSTHEFDTACSEFGYEKTPVAWDEIKRFETKCKLDAIVAHLYEIDKNELSYILDTFPITKRKDQDKFGQYKTKNRILELFDEYDWVKGRIYE